MPWFDCTAVLAYNEGDFSSLSLFTLHDESFWDLGSEALTSRVWQRIIAVHDVDLSNFSRIDVKRTPHVSASAKGLQTFAGGPPIEKDVNVDMRRYPVYSERPYVLNLCSFTNKDL